MPTPSTCIRCFKPITDDTLDLICETCRVIDLNATTRTQVAGEPSFETPTEKLQPTREAGRPFLPEKYEMLATLGAGGMGVVYKARERTLNRIEAVKMLRPFADQASRKRFEVEVQSLASLNHANIVSVYTVDLDRREPYFSMEYARGGTLASRIHKSKLHELSVAASIIEQVARAVHSAHLRGIIHRDIKPSNILFDENGTPKIADFGLAKRLLEDEELTHSQAVVGTPGYMAPEQARKKPRPVGPASDIYSLGSTLYTLITGKPPFRGVNYIDLAAQIRDIPPVPPKQLRPDVPESLNDIVLKCLEKNPEDRYPTAEALADDLQRYLKGEPVSLCPPSRLRKLSRRALAFRSPAMTAVLFVAIVVAVLYRPAIPTAAPAIEPPPSAVAKIDGLDEVRILELGHPTVLVADQGVPYWLDHNWLLGSATFRRSAIAEGACEWACVSDAMLAFCRDPGTDHYRVNLDLRWLKLMVRQGIPNRPNTPPEELVETKPGCVWLFCGYQRLRGNDGTEAIVAIGMQIASRINTGAARLFPAGFAKWEAVLIFLRPGQTPQAITCGLGQAYEIGLTEIPGPWWRLRLDVHADQIEGFWLNTPGSGSSVGIVEVKRLAEAYARLQINLNKFSPNGNYTIPPWNPRSPVGIWTERNCMAIRNVTIEPLSPAP